MSSKNEDYDRNAGLANLTDEERAAIADDDLDETEKAALTEIAGSEDDDDEDDEDEGYDEGLEPAKVEAKAEAKAEKPKDPEAETEAEPEAPAPTAIPRYEASLPEGYGEQVEAVNAEMTALHERFSAGEMEFAEFQAGLAKINQARDELVTQRLKADIAADMGQQSAKREWNDTVQRFMREAKRDEGIDYASKPILAEALDSVVRKLADTQENGDKPMEWFLKEAHRLVKDELGIAAKPASTSRKPPTEHVPKTLSHVPGSSGPGDVGDEFAELDNLEGDAYEFAMAKLSPVQRERYLAAA